MGGKFYSPRVPCCVLENQYFMDINSSIPMGAL